MRAAISTLLLLRRKTLSTNSVHQPPGFMCNRKTHKSKPQCSACLSLCATPGSKGAHRKQTLRQMELFIQLYALVGTCPFLIERPFTTWRWITNFHKLFSVLGGYIFGLYNYIFFFLVSRSIQRQETSTVLLIISLGLLSHRWTLSWPLKEIYSALTKETNIVLPYFYVYFLHNTDKDRKVQQPPR